MREFKFRGQDDNGKWHFGLLTKNKLNNFCILEKIQNKPEEYPDDYMLVGVVPETIGQYSDLKDKNGKEIYEGDILETYNQLNVVKYIEGCYRLIGLHKNKYERNYDRISEYLLDGTLRTIKSKFDGKTIRLRIAGNIY